MMDLVTGIGCIRCPKCDELFRTSINKLSEPIDVYFAWTDTLEDDTGEELSMKIDDDLEKKEEPDSDGYSDEILKDESDSERGGGDVNTTKEEDD